MSVTDVRTEVQAEGFTFEKLVPELPRQHIIIFRKGVGPLSSRQQGSSSED